MNPAVIKNVKEFADILTVNEAYVAMKLIGSEYDPIMVRVDKEGALHRTNIRTLYRDEDLSYLPATDLEVAFMGGPNSKRKMFRGSLALFVSDRLMRAAKDHGIEHVSTLLEELIERIDTRGRSVACPSTDASLSGCGLA